MRLKHYLVSSFVIVGTLSLLAQTTITKDLQSFRSGDKLTKQQVQYKDPGRSGTDVLWDFSTLKPINKNYLVEYYTPAVKRNGDSVCITCLEHRTMYKYVNKGDSLLLMGFENSGSKMSLENPEYVMRYPFTIGDSIVSLFKGNGSYENALASKTEGSLYVVADAIGTLILPDGDTLVNALRVKIQHSYQQCTKPLTNSRHRVKSKDSLNVTTTEAIIETADSSTTTTASSSKTNENTKVKSIISLKPKNQHAGSATSDSICFRTETYQWYVPGYRYPLFETINNHSRKNLQDTSEIKDITTAFYFPPSMHTYLENDSVNKAILDSLQNTKNQQPYNPNDTLYFHYNIYPNPVITDLQVELLLDFPSSVILSVYTLSGNAVINKNEGFYNAGRQTFSLNLSSLHFGEYLLYIKVNEQTAKSVLLKE
jgi:hypothetical protein